jgi:hypothetical protein
LVWRFLREENVELMRPLVRDVDKTSKYFSSSLVGLAFKSPDSKRFVKLVG